MPAPSAFNFGQQMGRGMSTLPAKGVNMGAALGGAAGHAVGQAIGPVSRAALGGMAGAGSLAGTGANMVSSFMRGKPQQTGMQAAPKSIFGKFFGK